MGKDKKLKGVQKAIEKKGGAIHPKSRRFKQLNKTTHKIDAAARKKADHAKIILVTVRKYKWFQSNLLGEEKTEYTKEEMLQLILAYINRHDEEIEQLTAQSKKPGHKMTVAKANRLEELESLKKDELKALQTCGYEAPDLTDGKSLEGFRTWGGDGNAFDRFKVKRFVATADEIATCEPLADVNMEEDEEEEDDE
eukprot:Colp12_sorted_trinity150504_noHs@21901